MSAPRRTLLTSRTGRLVVGASAAAWIMAGPGAVGVAAAHDEGDVEVQNTETVQVYTNATGEVDTGAREVYELVLEAQRAGLAAVRAGMGGKELDAVARDVISAAGHGDEFGHGLGHGVGIEIHEAPRLGKTSEDELVEGDVVTVEPGVYVAGRFGVRIEDLVSVESDGCRNLSSHPKELQVVG